jgi:hypothetical protein
LRRCANGGIYKMEKYGLKPPPSRDTGGGDAPE